MPGPQRIWIPQPASNLYKTKDADQETVRDSIVRQFGEQTVQRAELSVVLDLLMINRIISPSEFLDVMHKKLRRIDEQRRLAANLDEDRG